jgi:hypothetical protein
MPVEVAEVVGHIPLVCFGVAFPALLSRME